MTTIAAPLPSTLRIGLSRGAVEVKQFFRERDAVVFTFVLPSFILVMLGYIFDAPLPGHPDIHMSLLGLKTPVPAVPAALCGSMRLVRTR
jgi:ABC-2 type transport system permease protein